MLFWRKEESSEGRPLSLDWSRLQLARQDRDLLNSFCLEPGGRKALFLIRFQKMRQCSQGSEIAEALVLKVVVMQDLGSHSDD